MAAYAALVSIAQTTDLNSDHQDRYLFSIDEEENIRSIHEYVIFLLSFLEDSPKKASRWECKIRDVANKTQDIIEFLTWKRLHSSHPFSLELKEATVEIGLMAGAVMEERAADLAPAISSSSRLAPTGNDAVIGLHGDLMAIKERLCGQSSNLQVIPIVGMGGIGKTTLAKAIYDDQLIIEHFDIRAWLTISQDCSAQRIEEILSGLLDSIKKSLPRRTIDHESEEADEVGENYVLGQRNNESEDIRTKVHQILMGRRYLIVMDDVWRREVWDDVQNIFPDNGNGSRIMLTTRLSELAVYADSGSPLHEMRFMDDDQSWDLLKQKVFGNSNCQPELEDIGKKIARNCAGLPLALVLVAGVLSAISETPASWDEIANTVYPFVGGELEEILSLSYTHLPHHLRPCFLFIGGFPEDANIHASRLVKLWVADGFLKHKNVCNKSLEDEAEECLEDLAKRNLVIVTSRKSDGKIKCCSLHDMVRDSCIRKAEEEKFLLVMDERAVQQDMINDRRISFKRSDIDNIYVPTFIRTVLCIPIQISPSWEASLGRYMLLRVLDALGVEFKEIPSHVFKLYYLRYLALMGHFHIPSSISNLVNLQTLIIHTAFGKQWIRSYCLPTEIWGMRQLRHLVFNAPYMLPPPPDGSNFPLENLQTLSFVENLVWNERIVQMIPNVKRLGLVYTTDEVFHLHLLKDLHQLEKLEVIGRGCFSWLRCIPSFPGTLKKLSLIGGRYPWKKMGIIGSLPNLQVLKLLDNACDGRTWETADGDFIELNILLIDKSYLWQWITESSHFPRLKNLVLRSCESLKEIPEDIGNISTLELIEVNKCGKFLVESAKKIKEDQENNGNDALQVLIRDVHEEIQSRYKRMNPSIVELEDQLKNVRDKIGLFAREMRDAMSKLAPIGKDAKIGLDDDVMVIKDRLCGMPSKLQVVPIVGMGGIGKTTLARIVYEDQVIMEYFHIRVWVTVSHHNTAQEIILLLLYSIKLSRAEYERDEVVKEVCKNLMAQIVGEKIDNSEMAEKVHRNLMGRRYLIVMDNFWSKNVWDVIKNIFPDDSNGSRIMLTTRLSSVAAYPDSGSPLHEMRLMDDDQSWDLLKQKVFPNNDCPPGLEYVGKVIAKRCVGLPLAIVLVAGILSPVNKTRASWEEIVKNLNHVAELELEGTLSLSYTHLPRHLRPCFLFFGGFPENANIRASRLIKLWVAEGFFKHESGCSKSLEEEAEECLEDLVKRNLVQVTSWKSDGKIKSCRLHDMVRDFCIRKSQEEINDRRMISSSGSSILCFQLQDFPVWLAFSGDFRLFRALDDVGDGDEELPSQVFGLFNLRYLAINGSFKIPSAISNLVNLQTLIIHPTFCGRKNRYWIYNVNSSFSLPLEIWSMPQIRHLVSGVPFRLPHPPDGSNLPLENLQTLSLVVNLIWNEKILQMIPNVKRLGLVYTNVNEDYHLHLLEYLDQLEKLEVNVYYNFFQRGQNISFPKTLRKLCLVGGGFPWKDMGIIGLLPSLQVLKLLDYACRGETWVTADEEFPQLQYLLIDQSDLRHWITQSSHFPRLKSLVLRSCKSLMEIPQDIGNISSLELIEVDKHCPDSLRKLAKQINYTLQVRLHSDENGSVAWSNWMRSFWNTVTELQRTDTWH